jgi:hypothetical protein
LNVRPPRFLIALILGGLSLLGVFVAGARPAFADEPPANSKRAEARARFDRGLALLKEHDDAGALAEFKLTYDLAPAQQTLLMIGVLSANLNRPVEAVKTLDSVLANPGTLTAQQMAIARQRRDEQALKVGYLHVVTSAPATIQIDGVDVATTPIDRTIAVAAGTRLVAAVCSGYLPTRKEVAIAGGVTSELAFTLVPSELRAAHLLVRTSLVDADVVVDGERVARTPLPGSITIQPGDRLVELRRAGYSIASSKVTLGDGATAEVALAPVELTGAAVVRGTLILDASEPEVEVVVDGGARGVYRAPIALPAGRHLVSVVRGGFAANERVIDVPENTETRLQVTLTPTPETRDAYVAHARLVRRWGWIATAGGVAIAAAGGIATARLLPELNQAKRDRDALYATFNPGGHCNIDGGNFQMPECDPQLQTDNNLADSRAIKFDISIAVAGIGAAAVLTGVYLLLTGDDPTRYDTPASEDSAHPLLGFSANLGDHGGRVTLGGCF